MSNIYFTVGPSQEYPTIKKHIQRALDEDVLSMSHRGSQFMSMYQRVESKLKKLLSIPDDYLIYFLSSGTEGMERVLQNMVEKQSYHVVTGTFGNRFYHTAEELGKSAKMHVFNPHERFSANDVSVPSGTELIGFTHNDTSTGMQMPMKEIYAVGEQNPEALIAIDTVSSMPAVVIDYTKVDAVFFSVQKGFGLPAGLGVLILSPQALEKSKKLSEKGVIIGSYHNFLQLQKYAEKHQTPDTPNVLGIYLLDKVLTDFINIGIHKIREQTDEKAKLLYDFFTTDSRFTPVVTDKKLQSQTTLVIAVKGGSKDVVSVLKKQNIIIGTGYGDFKNEHIRIANFPAHSLDDIHRLISALQNV